MPNTFFGLSIGQSGLYTSQAGLNTTAHNISNVETKGYTRQTVNQQANRALKVNNTYGLAGSGVGVTGVTQARDEYYDEKYRTNNKISGTYSTKDYYMREIENYFNEVTLEGFTTSYDKMYDSIQELSKNPADTSVRTQVSSIAEGLCEYFNSLSNSLKSIQEDANNEIKTQVERVNSIGQQIAVLTRQINSMEVGGVTANDLRDQRNVLVDELSAYAKVSVSETVAQDNVGVTNYVVKLNGQALVDNYEINSLNCVPREEKVNQTDAVGLYEIEWANGQGFLSSEGKTGGTLHALLDVRDGNNNEAFKGKVTAFSGDMTITMTSTNVNTIEDLNIPNSGTLTIGNRNYVYNGFAVSKDEYTGEFTYEFSLDDDIAVDVVEPDGMRTNASIGKDVDFKGIPYYMAQLSKFVRTYSKAFNDISTSGVDLNGEAGLDFFNVKDAVTGENLEFKASEDDIASGYLFTSKTGDYQLDPDDEDYNLGSYYFMTAGNLSVTKKVMDDPNRIVTATDITDGIEQNNLVDKYIALKGDDTLFTQGTASQFLNTLVAEIGIDAAKATSFSKNQSNILASVTNQRLSVSGVDNEEEAMSLIRYQSAYGFSSKVISTLNQIYNKLINDTGV